MYTGDQLSIILYFVLTIGTSGRLQTYFVYTCILIVRVCVHTPQPALSAMALPPCHLLSQFYVSDGKLSCQVRNVNDWCIDACLVGRGVQMDMWVL